MSEDFMCSVTSPLKETASITCPTALLLRVHDNACALFALIFLFVCLFVCFVLLFYQYGNLQNPSCGKKKQEGNKEGDPYE